MNYKEILIQKTPEIKFIHKALNNINDENDMSNFLNNHEKSYNFSVNFLGDILVKPIYHKHPDILVETIAIKKNFNNEKTYVIDNLNIQFLKDKNIIKTFISNKKINLLYCDMYGKEFNHLLFNLNDKLIDSNNLDLSISQEYPNKFYDLYNLINTLKEKDKESSDLVFDFLLDTTMGLKTRNLIDIDLLNLKYDIALSKKDFDLDIFNLELKKRLTFDNNTKNISL